MFFAAYVGSSMNPTLRQPEIMEVRPYNSRPLRVGDVAFFVPPETDRPVVHRILRVTPSGVSTLGDNNAREDPLLLPPESIQGQVVVAWHGRKRRKIAGGLQGRLTGRWLRGRRVLVRGASSLLLPLYQALSHQGWIARLLPGAFQPRVIVFRAQGRDQLKLIMGQLIIGRYDEPTQQWQIQRPFHLFVDQNALAAQQVEDRANRQAAPEQPRPLNPILAQGVRYDLVLADGSRWEIAAVDKEAASVISQLGCVMQLRTSQGPAKRSQHGTRYRLVVKVDANMSVSDCNIPAPSRADGLAVCILSPCEHFGGPFVNFSRLSLIVAREAQLRGGVLIHGALAERDGAGVILAAAGGTGKTTASRRFPAPWRSLCDDTTLVVRDTQGNYWAHPWPTWSRFLDEGPGGTWDVQNAVPLKGIFFLARAAEDRAERVGPGHAVSLLGECAGQVSALMHTGMFRAELRALHLERFNNLCTLAGAVPAHVLHISLTGAFWREIEQTLATASTVN